MVEVNRGLYLREVDATSSVDFEDVARRIRQCCAADDLETLGVEVVEGEHPGSTYYAAELRGDIDEANRAADAAASRCDSWRPRLICGPTGRQHRSDRLRLSLPETPAHMYVIDLTHYLDTKGAIAPERGPARKMADFLTAVVAHASDFDRPDDAPGPVCFKCRKRDQRVVETDINEDDVVVWRCLACGTEGRISNWQGTFWDLSRGTPSS